MPKKEGCSTRGNIKFRKDDTRLQGYRDGFNGTFRLKVTGDTLGQYGTTITSSKPVFENTNLNFLWEGQLVFSSLKLPPPLAFML